MVLEVKIYYWCIPNVNILSLSLLPLLRLQSINHVCKAAVLC